MAAKIIRPIIVDGQVAFVPLTQGLVATIDASDLHLVEGRNWCATRMGNIVYGVTKINRASVLLHAAIMGKRPGFQVDHIDGDGLNNRRSNLRFASKAQNQWNRAIPSNNKSGIKGASWCSTNKKWRAAITVSGKYIGLGYFQSPEEAGEAYKVAALKHHGEYFCSREM